TVTILDSRASQILNTPTNLFTTAGQDATLNYSVTGDLPIITSLVRTNGHLRATSTDNSMFLPALLSSDSGQYYLVASNAYGVATSTIFQIQAAAPTNVIVLLDANNALKIIGTDGNDSLLVRLSAANSSQLEITNLNSPGTSWLFPA